MIGPDDLLAIPTEPKLTVLGQALIGHDLRAKAWPDFAALTRMLGRADAVFTDLETAIATPLAEAPTRDGVFLHAAPPAVLAWRALWLARLEYVESSPPPDSHKLLLRAINRGWTIIDGGYAEAFRTATHNTSPTLCRRLRPREPAQKPWILLKKSEDDKRRNIDSSRYLIGQ
jgi:hypothetical protein